MLGVRQLVSGAAPLEAAAVQGMQAAMSKQLTLKQQAFVSALIGPAKGNATEAARLAGYRGSENTLGVVGIQNIRNPKIMEMIEAHRSKVEKNGIAHLQTRVDGYNERREQFLQIVRDRGWMAKTTKMIGGGDNAEKVEEFAFDAALARELRELEKQAAQDLGQWTEKKELYGADGTSIQIVSVEIVREP